MILRTVHFSVIAYMFTYSGEKDVDLEPKRGSIALRLFSVYFKMRILYMYYRGRKGFWLVIKDINYSKKYLSNINTGDRIMHAFTFNWLSFFFLETKSLSDLNQTSKTAIVQ